MIYYADAEGHELPPSVRGKPAGAKRTMVWSDANDDGQRQPEELSGIDGEMRFNGWNLWVTPDLTLYSGTSEFRARSYTPCGAPCYDLAQPTEMPIAGLGSADGKLVLSANREGTEIGWMQAMDIASGKQLWQYPDTYVGVHVVAQRAAADRWPDLAGRFLRAAWRNCPPRSATSGSFRPTSASGIF